MMNSAATIAFDLPTSFCLPLDRHCANSEQPRDLPEQELAVEVTDINGVHIYYVDILEARQR